MAGPIDVEEQAMLNGVFNDPAYAPPATRYLGLSSTTPLDDGSNFTEPTATTAADWDAATGSTPATKKNGTALSFPTATAEWVAGAPLTHFGIFDATTGGSPKWWGVLTVAKIVGAGDTAQFASQQLTLQLGDPGDTY